MNCLFCGKRLGFFHGKNKPYCSDVHEDRYREQQSRTALDRLQDEIISGGPPKLPTQEAPKQDLHERTDSSPLQTMGEAEESSLRVEQIPPLAPYLIAEHPAPPLLFLLDPDWAAFPAEDWEVEPLVQSSSALLSLGLSQIGPGLMSFAGALLQPEQTEPEPPAEITSLSPLETRALSGSEPVPASVFCDPILDIAMPGLALQARHSALAPKAARNQTTSLERPAHQSLPSPQPLRFRTVLDLNNPIFETTRRRIATAGRVPMAWKAVAPETIQWPSKPTRRTAAALLPKISPVAVPMEGPDK